MVDDRIQIKTEQFRSKIKQIKSAPSSVQYIFGTETLLALFLITSLKFLTVSAFKEIYLAALFSKRKEVVESPERIK